MANTPPADQLGQLLLLAMGAGASSRTLGEFARLQCAASAEQALDAATLGEAFTHLVDAGADATVLGRFATLSVSTAQGAAVKPIPEVASTVRDLVREEVRAEMRRSPPHAAGRPAARKGAILKLTLSTGRTTSLSLPKDLVEGYKAAFGQAALRDLLKRSAGGAVPAGLTRSHLARLALEQALEAHRADQAKRSPLTLVSR